ncbi:hypothetical protein [Virgibacillus sp. MG-45]|uniref:hypothetical protein n=1 Tax=Virgibacillus sp. MG-45 TaxID=3102791 RepID=UPI002EDB4B94
MFILENVFIALVVAVLFFILFTFANILVYTRDFLTGVFLTIIFFDLFLRMPFKAVNRIYGEKEKIIRKLKKSQLSIQEQELIIKNVQSRPKLFFMLYRLGELSYSELMMNLKKWYTKKPFRIRIKVVHMNRKRFEDKYFHDLQKELSTLEST